MKLKERITDAWMNQSPNKAQAITAFMIFTYHMTESEIGRLLHVHGIPAWDWRDMLVDQADDRLMNWSELFAKAERERVAG